MEEASALAHVRLLTLGVQAPFRRKGVGRALVHGVARRLRASSCEHATGSLSVDDLDSSAILVQADVAHSNISGKSFYSCLGMKEQCGSNPDIRFATGTHLVAGLLAV